MSRILWKELREKRIWASLVVLVMTGGVALGQWQNGLLGSDSVTTWLCVSATVALLMGVTTYSPEVDGADFIGSRPIGWKKLLLGKLAIGLGAVVLGAVLSAVVFAVTVPEQYAQFGAVGNLAAWAGALVGFVGLAYIIGAACSVVLPGFVGGLLTALGAFVLFGVETFVLGTAMPRGGSLTIMATWPSALVVAGVLVARFGLTLSASARLTKFALALGIVLLATSPVVLLDHALGRLLLPRLSQVSVSSDGRYAVMEHYRLSSSGTWARDYLVRLSDGKGANINWVGEHGNSFWTDSGTAYSCNSSVVITARMDRRGKVHQSNIQLGRFTQGAALVEYPTPSPSGRYLALSVRRLSSDTRGELLVVDVEKGTVVDLGVQSDVNFWWQSERAIGYYSPSGSQVVELPADIQS